MPVSLPAPGNPDAVDVPRSPPLVAVVSTIDPSPEGSEAGGDVLMAEDAGPSTFLSPPLSPLLPDLRSRPFPPDLDDDEEEDEILHRLPVYLSPGLFPSINLFQYPLQHQTLRAPTWASDRGKVITSRIKESVGRVEIEVPVDADPKVWRDERAREIGFVPDIREANGDAADIEGGYQGSRAGVDRRRRDKEKENKWGEKMRLRSEVVPISSASSHYSGIIHDGALHLHPISRMVQLRTSLGYMDDFEARSRASLRRNDHEDDDGKGKTAVVRKEPPIKALDDPQNDGSGSIKDFRNKMWSTAQKEDEDKWVPYKWKEGAEDEKVTRSLQALLVPEDKRQLLECQSRGLDFLDRDA